MLLKIVLIAALVGVGLFVAKEEKLFERAGLVGYCQEVRPPPGADGQWHGCVEGVLTGYPNLVQDSCTRESRRPGTEYWRCPIALTASAP